MYFIVISGTFKILLRLHGKESDKERSNFFMYEKYGSRLKLALMV